MTVRDKQIIIELASRDNKTTDEVLDALLATYCLVVSPYSGEIEPAPLGYKLGFFKALEMDEPGYDVSGKDTLKQVMSISDGFAKVTWYCHGIPLSLFVEIYDENSDLKVGDLWDFKGLPGFDGLNNSR